MPKDSIENTLYWIWLSKTRLLKPREKKILTQQLENPKLIYELVGKEESLSGIYQIFEKHQSLNIKAITPMSDLYKEGMPLVTYYKGHPQKGKQVAIVGTRKPSVEGSFYAKKVTKQYIEDKFTINSGLAHGIDTIVHKEALKWIGMTQAFVAHGLDRCYPKNHQEIFEEIIERGCIYSQYEAGVEADRFRFLERNKLMVQMSNEVAVIEAGEKSGALSTGKIALKLKKPTSTLVTPNDSFKCAGNHMLIKSGAQFIKLKDETICCSNLQLCELLRLTPMTMEDILEATTFDYTSLYIQLFELENQSWISFKADGKWHYNGW